MNLAAVAVLILVLVILVLVVILILVLVLVVVLVLILVLVVFHVYHSVSLIFRGYGDSMHGFRRFYASVQQIFHFQQYLRGLSTVENIVGGNFSAARSGENSRV